MSKRVLIVDDAGFMRQLLKDILMDEGFEVVGEGPDGEAGVQLYKELSPDLVTMDINMPRLDGTEALGQILRHDPHARVIMVTTAGQDDLIKRTLLMGARDFIVKPFKKHQVVSTVKRIIKDTGTPQSFMEELVAWFELGETLMRNDLLTPERLSTLREQVKSGAARNLYEAVVRTNEISDEDLRDAYDAGHKEVSMAFLLLKGKAVSMAQLRCAFVMMRKTGKKLGFTLTELGFCDKDAVAEAMKAVPPSRMTTA